ncbi:hypothetical protein TeGR_g15207 [Tetraparma gracilis]|uniref:Fe2OG dioxygenase domain-containing protein n=1 Tax=Tetraparma gracilis TaxID=2962635 RepID=A0ABQ6MYV1_9STRA|nr:hypothetical protein TeGR_g15207 [Tetraparma gracilis]
MFRTASSRRTAATLCASLSAFTSYHYYLFLQSTSTPPDPRERLAIARLPSLAAAQRTPVLRIPGFLSAPECDALLSLSQTPPVSSEAGSFSRDAFGVRHASTLLEAPWRTAYLHSSPSFCTKHLPPLLARVRAAVAERCYARGSPLLAALPGGAPALAGLGARTVEVHESVGGGGLVDERHFDGGSIFTVDILLTSDFTGGRFATLEIDEDGKEELVEQEFNKGDLIIFLSHKYHTVKKVTGGRRATFVMELWETDEQRTCPHRCCQRYGECTYSKADVLMDRMLGAVDE